MIINTCAWVLRRHEQYNLMVFATVLGRGTRLFLDGAASPLALAECKRIGSGIVLLRYPSAT